MLNFRGVILKWSLSTQRSPPNQPAQDGKHHPRYMIELYHTIPIRARWQNWSTSRGDPGIPTKSFTFCPPVSINVRITWPLVSSPQSVKCVTSAVSLGFLSVMKVALLHSIQKQCQLSQFLLTISPSLYASMALPNSNASRWKLPIWRNTKKRRKRRTKHN